MFRQIGPTEILVVLGVVLLLFGGKKLPELARGSGKALRIFKSEVKALHDDDDDDNEVKPASLETARTTEPDKKPEQG
jgi:sec-independent protein translocase protein TatA